MSRSEETSRKAGRDVVVGSAVIPACNNNGKWGWMLPGRIFTASWADAEAAARIINAEREKS